MGARYLKTEEEAIVERYPTASRAEILTLIPDRTWAQIGVHARSMGIHRATQSWGNSIREGRKVLRNSWSEADNMRLDKLYPTETRADLLAGFPNRSYIAIRSHAQRRHLQRTFYATGREINIGREKAKREAKGNERPS